jgi:hypothetical protein
MKLFGPHGYLVRQFMKDVTEVATMSRPNLR